MARITFDDFLADVDQKHQSFEIELPDGDIMVFRNLLRLPKEKRVEIAKVFKRFEKVDENGDEVEVEVTEDEAELFKGALQLAATDQKIFTKFAKLVPDDAAAWTELIFAWVKVTQVGEA